MNVHQGHRQRLRQRYEKNGLEAFEDHEVLEMLLFQSIPFKDTNELAHRLLDTFSTLANVLDAPVERLCSVEGMTEIAAINLSMLKDVFARYKKSRAEVVKLDTLGKILRYGKEVLTDYGYEQVCAVFLSHDNTVLGKKTFCDGSPGHVFVPARKIAQEAIAFNAAGLVLFHTHPKGKADPSEDDKDFTETLFSMLMSMDVVLLEHLILGETDFYSFFSRGALDLYRENYYAKHGRRAIAQNGAALLNDNSTADTPQTETK